MKDFMFHTSNFIEKSLDALMNLSQFHIILLASVFFVLVLVSFFIIVILKVIGSRVKQSDMEEQKVVNAINERIDKIDTVIQGLQQDRARYQQGVTSKLNDITDKIEVITNAFNENAFKDGRRIDPLNLDELRDPKFKDIDAISARATVRLEKIAEQDTQAEATQEINVSDKPSEEATEEIAVGGVTEEIDISGKTEEISPGAKTDEIKASFEKGLKKTRSGFFVKLKDLFSGRDSIDVDDLEELEAILVSSDMGISMTKYFLDRLKEEDLSSGISKDGLMFKLKKYIVEVLETNSAGKIDLATGPAGHVILCVGVNGVGKTTTVAKLANRYKEEGKKVLLVAADTFRAAAVEQLESWSSKIDVDIVRGKEGAKPASVIYDAMEKAKNEEYDVVLADTAGRLHNKSNLMQELEGIRNVVRKTDVNAPHEVLLVVDGSTGQNALMQAKEFKATVQPTGLVVTKLDGTPKGGIVVAIQHECEIPVNFIGLGEKKEDLREFNAENFVNVLFDESSLY